LKSKIAIVGGTGFIGKSLSKQLSKEFDVKILDLRAPDKDLESIATFASCDVRNEKEVEAGVSDVDLVIHTAIIQIPLINENRTLGYEVNVKGTQNVCAAVEENPRIKGMILAGTWHTIGERDLSGKIDEEFGFRPDKVEERARLYALSKMAQDAIVRYYDEISSKIYGIVRMGTVLGEGMPPGTAADIFIKKAILGEPITPFKHSMYRPMLYADIADICRAYSIFASGIMRGKFSKENNSLAHVVNIYYPEPITILNLAEIVRKSVIEYTGGK
jgi:UDP-glucose 4-epimerase